MRVALATALLFGGALMVALAAVVALILVRGNSELTSRTWIFVGIAGAVGLPSLVVGVRLLRGDQGPGDESGV